MKIVFQGSVATGFSPIATIDERDVEAYLKSEVFLPEDCKHREFVNVQDAPSPRQYTGGSFFVIHASNDGPASGVIAYGPFQNDDIAESFAEETRSEDCEYSIVELKLWSPAQ